MKFYEKHKDLRDKFEIVAFHDGTVKTFRELDEKLVQNKSIEAWGGHNLPFPVVLDSTGMTVKRYDLVRFPTTLLVDPNGILIGEGDEENLAKKLGL